MRKYLILFILCWLTQVAYSQADTTVVYNYNCNTCRTIPSDEPVELSGNQTISNSGVYYYTGETATVTIADNLVFVAIFNSMNDPDDVLFINGNTDIQYIFQGSNTFTLRWADNINKYIF